ncbi:hypothetical protein K8I61_08560 [bacterium]|nr:hypothetical protein [bacterium]
MADDPATRIPGISPVVGGLAGIAKRFRERERERRRPGADPEDESDAREPEEIVTIQSADTASAKKTPAAPDGDDAPRPRRIDLKI